MSEHQRRDSNAPTPEALSERFDADGLDFGPAIANVVAGEADDGDKRRSEPALTDSSSPRRIAPMSPTARQRLLERAAAHVQTAGFQQKLAAVRRQREQSAATNE
jgi:hypothetical protein